MMPRATRKDGLLSCRAANKPKSGSASIVRIKALLLSALIILLAAGMAHAYAIYNKTDYKVSMRRFFP